MRERVECAVFGASSLKRVARTSPRLSGGSTRAIGATGRRAIGGADIASGVAETTAAAKLKTKREVRVGILSLFSVHANLH